MLVTKARLRTHPLAYAALLGLFVLSVSVFVRGVSDSSDLMRHSTEYARPPFDLGDGNWGAVNLQPEAEEQGMKFGDAVLAVNGRAIDGFFVYYGLLRHARAGDQLHVRVRSPGPGTNPVRDLSIVLRPFR